MSENEHERRLRKIARLLVEVQRKTSILEGNLRRAAADELEPGPTANNILANAGLAGECAGNLVSIVEGIDEVLLESAPVNLPRAIS
jgi:hypothetical protein